MKIVLTLLGVMVVCSFVGYVGYALTHSLWCLVVCLPLSAIIGYKAAERLEL